MVFLKVYQSVLKAFILILHVSHLELKEEVDTILNYFSGLCMDVRIFLPSDDVTEHSF